MEGGNTAGERHKLDTADGDGQVSNEPGPTGGQEQSLFAERGGAREGGDPGRRRHHAGPSKREPSSERKSTAAGRPPQPDHHGLDSLAESPDLRNTLEALFRGVIREETRSFKDKLQELESALGKQAEPGTLSPTTSKSSSLAPTVAAGQLRNESPPAEPPARQLTVRFSDEVETSGDAGRQTIRPQKPSDGLSVVDQAWGLLFDSNDEPTARLEEVLRGLANYIAEQFLPRRSLVITPEKLSTLYSHGPPSQHPFDYADIFRHRSKALNDAASDLFLTLGCEYHLVQPDEKGRPSVPGLTPAGFSRWIVVNMRAYPDEEARRLERIVSLFPVEADSPLDGKRERLPRQISRRLLPARPDPKHQTLLDGAVGVFSRAAREQQPPRPRHVDTVTAAAAAAAAARDRRPPAPSPRSRYLPSPRDRGTGDPRYDDDRSAGGGGHGRDRDHERRHTSGGASRPHHESPPLSSRRQSHSGTAGLVSPPSSVSRSSAGRRPRSPQARSCRGSNTSVHNHHGGGGSGGGDARRASLPVFSFLAGSGDLPALPERSARERDGDRDRDREPLAYRLYSSPRDSRASVEEPAGVPRHADRQLMLPLAAAPEGEPGETWADYFSGGRGRDGGG